MYHSVMHEPSTDKHSKIRESDTMEKSTAVLLSRDFVANSIRQSVVRTQTNSKTMSAELQIVSSVRISFSVRLFSNILIMCP